MKGRYKTVYIRLKNEKVIVLWARWHLLIKA